MENATKALLIVGTILITLIIMSIGISLFTALAKNADAYRSTIADIKIQKFNSSFVPYIGEDKINAHEITTLINYAKEQEYKVNVRVIDKLNNILNYDTIKGVYYSSEEFISKYENEYSFICLGVQYDEEGRINKIIFRGDKNI